MITNVFDADRASFGTFNINQATDELERFLTPVQPRQARLVARRRFGG